MGRLTRSSMETAERVVAAGARRAGATVGAGVAGVAHAIQCVRAAGHRRCIRALLAVGRAYFGFEFCRRAGAADAPVWTRSSHVALQQTI